MPENDPHRERLKHMYAAAPTDRYFNPGMTLSEGRATVTVKACTAFYYADNAVHGSVALQG